MLEGNNLSAGFSDVGARNLQTEQQGEGRKNDSALNVVKTLYCASIAHPALLLLISEKKDPKEKVLWRVIKNQQDTQLTKDSYYFLPLHCSIIPPGRG